MRDSTQRTSRAHSPGQVVSVAEAKANLSALLSAVEQRHDPVIISRRGVPVAQIDPIAQATKPVLRGSMAGTGWELGDIVTSYAEEWHVAGL